MSRKDAERSLANHLGCRVQDLKISVAQQILTTPGWEFVVDSPSPGVYWVTRDIGIRKLS